MDALHPLRGRKRLVVGGAFLGLFFIRIALRDPLVGLLIVAAAALAGGLTVVANRKGWGRRPRHGGWFVRFPVDGAYPDTVRMQLFPPTSRRWIFAALSNGLPATGRLSAGPEGLRWQPIFVHRQVGRLSLPRSSITRVWFDDDDDGRHRMHVLLEGEPAFWAFVESTDGLAQHLVACGIAVTPEMRPAPSE